MSKTVMDAAAWKALQARIGAMKPDSARLWGKMNAAQCLCHLADQLRLASGEIKSARKPSFMGRTFMKWLVLAGMPAPKGKVQTADEIDQMSAGTKPTDFEADRATLLRLIEDFRALPADHRFTEHPFFGNMTQRQWGKLIFTHLDHHLNQFGC